MAMLSTMNGRAVAKSSTSCTSGEYTYALDTYFWGNFQLVSDLRLISNCTSFLINAYHASKTTALSA